jgi:hypothetical protein
MHKLVDVELLRDMGGDSKGAKLSFAEPEAARLEKEGFLKILTAKAKKD